MPLLIPPPDGVVVRMYRIGHGDCFLLAFPREQGGNPVYLLIDCGQKPGSENYIHTTGIPQIVNHLFESTGGILDVAIFTHEHQDHVNGVYKKTDPYFKDFTIKEAWLAWTENPADDLANRLRKDHKDTLINLVRARHDLALAAGPNSSAVKRLDGILSGELGVDSGPLGLSELLAAADPANSPIKQGLKFIKDKARQNDGIRYLSPGRQPQTVNATNGIRAFVLGPPRKETLLVDEDPMGDEAFPQELHGLTFAGALRADGEPAFAPFESVQLVPKDSAFETAFFRDHYGRERTKNDVELSEVEPNAPWRRIDSDWLNTAEYLAIKLNEGINNTSLALAFELPLTRKVLLFIGDAQRGNWISWPKCKWEGADSAVTAKDLLARTVLYKVGHHGSHNATLDGKPDSTYPNLSWMGAGAAAGEFTALITAVAKWAEEKTENWVHPLPSIKSALVAKAQGRVFQTDTDSLTKPQEVADAEWQEFLTRATFNDLYFDYVVLDR